MSSSAAAALEKWRPLLAVLLLLGLGAIVRLFQLGSPSLWLDEGYSVNVASGELQDILVNPLDPHPPLYYVLLHFWLGLGRSEFVIRLLSAIPGVLAIPLTYSLARLWYSERSALLAAVLLSLSPLHVWYSQEARMYSLLVFLGLASVLSLSLMLRRFRATWWVIYAISSLAGLYIHYAMIALLVAEYLFIAGWWSFHKTGVRTLVSLALAQVFVLLGFLPLGATFLDTAEGFGGFHSIGRVEFLLGNAAPAMILAILSVLALAVVGALALWHRGVSLSFLRTDAWLTSAVLICYASLTVFSAFPIATSMKRQLVFALPYFLLLASATVGKLTRRRLLTACMVLLACVALVVSYTNREIENWRGADSIVEAEGLPGDVILFHAFYVRYPFNYYYQGILPQVDVDKNSFETQLSQISGKYDRAWVVISREEYEDPQHQVRNWIDGEWHLIDKTGLGDIAVALYHIPGPASPEATTQQ